MHAYIHTYIHTYIHMGRLFGQTDWVLLDLPMNIAHRIAINMIK